MVVYNVTINITLVVFYTCLTMNKPLLFMAHKYTLLQHSYKDSATTAWKDCVTTNYIIKLYLPQIFSGASNSSKIGWLRNISRDFKQRPRTSASVICTVFPGRHPLAANKSKVMNKILKSALQSVELKLCTIAKEVTTRIYPVSELHKLQPDDKINLRIELL